MDTIKNPHVIELLTVANEFCYFTEQIGNYQKEELLPVLQKILALLYLKGSLLPDFQYEDTESIERFVTEEEWELIHQSIKKVFADEDVFNYLNDEDDIQTTEISEQLADIYQDMKDFILLYKKNISNAQKAAIHEVIRLYKSNWGIKCLLLNNILHKMRFITT
jgi:hypothetical protein